MKSAKHFWLALWLASVLAACGSGDNAKRESELDRADGTASAPKSAPEKTAVPGEQLVSDEDEPGTRVITFPENATAGDLSVRDWGSRDWADWDELGQARGKVTIPAGKEVGLEVAEEALPNLIFVHGLSPNDIQALSFTMVPFGDGQLALLKR